MRIFLFSLIFLFLPELPSAQVPVHVEQILPTLSREPLVDTLLYLAKQYFNETPAKSFKYASDAMILSESINYTSGKWRSCVMIGDYNAHSGNYVTAMQYYLKARSISELSKEPHRDADITKKIGDCYLHTSELEKALNHYNEALKIYRQLDDAEGICQVLTQMGTYYGMACDFEKSRGYFNEALQIAQTIKDEKGISHILNNIGNCYRLNGEFDEALKYNHKAYETALKGNDKKMLATTLNNLAGIYLAKKDYAHAKEYAFEAEKIANEINYKYAQIKILDVLSVLYVELGNYGEANKYYKRLIQAQNEQQAANSAEHIANLQVLYDLAGKERQVEDLQNEARLSRLKSNIYAVLLIGISLILIGLGIMLYLRMRIAKKRSLLFEKEYNLEQQALEQEKSQHHLLAEQMEIARKNYEMDLEKLELKKQQADLLVRQMSLEKQQSDIQFAKMEMEKNTFEEELASKNRELVSTTMQMLQKTESFASLRTIAAELRKEHESTTVDKLFQTIDHTTRFEKDWNTFVLHFTKVHPGFFDALQQKYPELTEKDIKHCAYIRMRLSLKEVATLMNISVRGVQKARTKVHALMKLDENTSLYAHLQNF